MQTPQTPLLIRPRPIHGESLSSWRQRTAWANFYRLFPVHDERTRRADPDLGASEGDLLFVAQLHMSTRDVITGMTFRGLEGTLIDHVKVRSHCAWWLSAGYCLRDREHGSMFCPLCLAEDAIPHFRLHWRLGFVTDCADHGVRLRDRCTVCNHPPWPGGCGSRGRVHRYFTSLRHCWHCGADYGLMAASKCKVHSEYRHWLRTEKIVLGAAEISPNEGFAALHSICRLFLRKSTRKCILDSGTSWADVIGRLSPNTSGQHFERLVVSDRAVLLESASQILENWPSSFTSFAREAGLSLRHFDEMRALLPTWMAKVVQSDLALQNRNVTDVVLREKFDALTKEFGRPPTKTALRQALNWQGERGLETLFPERWIATEQEWQMFVDAVRALDGGRLLRPQDRRALLSNIAVLLVCLVENKDICAVGISTKQEWVDRLVSTPSESWEVTDSLAQIIESLMPDFQMLRKPHISSFLQSPVNHREVIKRLRLLMSKMSDELVRDVRVFETVQPAS